ncbi:putative peptide transporter ptr2 [Mycena sanguinolenta]|uniref:Putative peptide transporter ptr2 n=1 Tax=Mycena sanguinolenta TaxID=230812 RepID=A0A8H6YME9_9AGAR|nr:putative peptide transporter ptr2 [Mycena sanguinolenta]
MPSFTSYKYEPLRIHEDADRETDGEQYEMNDGSSSKLYPIDGIHDGLVCPTEEELATLRHVGDVIPWNAYLIAIVELAERFSYYGAGVVFTNFIQYPLPVGSHTGAGLLNGQSGALGRGQHASTGITTSYQFWCSVTPFAGAYIADVHLGRFNTICVAVVIALLGHIILIVAAVPGIIEHPDTALAIFLAALFVMGLGTGLFKANISPLVAEQYKRTKPFVVTNPTGEQVIVDPTLTVSRIYMYFYLMINLGSLLGQVLMTYSEKASFWLAYTLPTVVFLLCPIILVMGRKRYVRSPPTSSVLATFVCLLRFASRGCWSINPLRTWRNLTAPDFWDAAKPSRILPAARPSWMTFHDKWVDEVRWGLRACTVFAWFPIYWLTVNQLNNNLTSQAATLTTNGVPNDLLSNLDPLVLVLCIPLCDFFLYPALQKWRIRFTPLKRITIGFLLGKTILSSPRFYTNPSVFMQVPPLWFGLQFCSIVFTKRVHAVMLRRHARIVPGTPRVSPLNVWIQAPAYILIALSEIFASITGFEYAFSKAPENMRSLVTALFMGTGAVSAILAEGFLWLAADPLLVWNYAVMGTLAGCGGCAFWLAVRHLDLREEEEVLRVADDREELDEAGVSESR